VAAVQLDSAPIITCDHPFIFACIHTAFCEFVIKRRLLVKMFSCLWLPCRTNRVPETKSFFSITSSNLPTCVQPYSVPACRCTGGDRRIEESVRVACATPPTGDFLIKLDMSTVCNTRRRRSVAGVDQNSYEDLISIDDFNNVFLAPIPIYPATTTRRPSTTRFTQPGRHLYIAHRGISGNSRSILNSRSVARVASVDIVSMTIDAEQATTRCRESLRSSTIYSLCNSRVDTTIIISTCALDVQVNRDKQLQWRHLQNSINGVIYLR